MIPKRWEPVFGKDRALPNSSTSTQPLVSGERLRASETTGELALKIISSLAVAGVLAGATLPAAALDISGAGATFPYPI
jgi:hypothetical protein